MHMPVCIWGEYLA